MIVIGAGIILLVTMVSADPSYNIIYQNRREKAVFKPSIVGLTLRFLFPCTSANEEEQNWQRFVFYTEYGQGQLLKMNMF